MDKGSRARPYMYGLSTCGWCAKARAWLEQNAKEFDLVYVDLLDGGEQSRLVAELGKYASTVAFPMVFFGSEVVVGYRPEEYERLLEKKE